MFPLKYTGILWLLQLTTRLIGKSPHDVAVSREDFHAMAEIAHEEGVFLENESKVIKNLIDFKTVLVKDIMTPRTVMKIASEKTTIQEFYDKNPNLRFSRIPIYGKTQDEIKSYILKDEMLESIIKGKGNDLLKTIEREILVTERNLPIPNLFDILIKNREHVALVVDEYGSVNGIVTQEDIIETLLGLEIVDESDSDADLQVLARNIWEKRAKRLGIINDTNE